MGRYAVRFGMGLVLMFVNIQQSYALDSYRFLHVTIETPWLIFIFLLGTIFVPFILMALLVWRYAEKNPEADDKPEPAPLDR